MEKPPTRIAAKSFPSDEKTRIESVDATWRVLNSIKIKDINIKGSEIKVKTSRISIGRNLVQAQGYWSTITWLNHGRIYDSETAVIDIKKKG